MPDSRKPQKSKYTKDRQIPGAYEGETVTRRRFMTGSAHTAGAIATSAFLLPAAAFAIGPIFDERNLPWQDIGPVDRFPDDSYIPVTISIGEGIGEAGKSTVYVRRHKESIDGPLRDDYDQVVALSNRCMHLGCPIRYTGAAQRFICPCHGGVYDFTGKVDGGPPVRPLDRFYTRIRDDRVEVGRRYSVNSQLRRFSPRDPGQPLDGIGQYVYPSRPSVRKLPNT